MEILPSCHSNSDISINSNERSAAPEQETGGLPCFHFPGAPAFSYLVYRTGLLGGACGSSSLGSLSCSRAHGDKFPPFKEGGL